MANIDPRIIKLSDLYNSLSYKNLQKCLHALKSYRPPKDVYPFLVIGTLLGINMSYIYNHLTTVKSRQALWNKLRITWKDYVKTQILVSKSKWQRFKNRIDQLLGGASKKHFKNYYDNLEDATKMIIKFYSCLFKHDIIKSSQIKNSKIMGENKEEDKKGDKNKEDEKNKENKDKNKEEDVFEKSPIEFFGKKFKKGKLSSLAILIHIITVDYAVHGRKPIPQECLTFIEKFKICLIDIKTALEGLQEERGILKINRIIDLWEAFERDI